MSTQIETEDTRLGGFGHGAAMASADHGLVGNFSLHFVSALGFWSAFAVVVSVMLSDFFDTAGTVLGLGRRAELVEPDGRLPGMRRVLIVDSLAAAGGGAASASLARGENEFDHAGLEMAPSRMVEPPRVAASPVAFECKVTETLALTDLDGNRTDRHLVIGQVVGVHVDERYVKDGILDVTAIRPIARCGYTADYTVLDRLFQMRRPP